MRRFALTICVIGYALVALAGMAAAAVVSFDSYWPNQVYLAEPSGVAVDSAGNIYIADTKNHRIVKIDSAGNTLASWGVKGISSGTLNDNKFYYPYGLCIGYNGDLYVCDTGNCRIKRMTTSGTVLKTWGGGGSTNGRFDWPLGICTDASNNVYVADSGQYRGTICNRIQKFDENGNFLKTWGGFSESPSNNGYALPASVTYFPPLDRIYIADCMHSRVAMTDTQGTWIGSWTGPTDLPLHAPRGICYVPTAGSQYFVIADTNHDRILKTTSAGMKLFSRGSGQSSEEGKFFFPRAVAADASGNIYVADTFNQRIQKLNSSGYWVATFGGRGTIDGMFDRPFSIATDSAGNVYVADSYNNRVQKFNASGSFLMSITVRNEAKPLNRPEGVTVDGSGNIHVADTESNYIEKYNSAGTFISKFGSYGDGDHNLNRPRGVAVDSAGNTYVADMKNHRVKKFGSGGTFIMSIGEKGHDPGQFDEPTDVEVDASGNIYVADYGNHRIQKFNSAGTLVWCVGGFGTGDGQFHYPSGIDVDSSGNVYVADTGNQRAQILNSSGGFIVKWGAWGSLQGEFRDPIDIAVGGGAVYVLERSNYRVSKFTVTL